MKLDDRYADRARKNQTALLGALRTVGQNRVAEIIGESDSQVSRSKDDFPRFSAILAACGLKVVPEDKKFVEPEYLQALSCSPGEGWRPNLISRTRCDLFGL